MRKSLIGLACLVGVCAVPWKTAFSEERYIGALHGWIVVDEHGPDASDAILLDVRFLEDTTDTRVLSGTVSGGNPNCQLVRTTSSTLNVQGCNLR